MQTQTHNQAIVSQPIAAQIIAQGSPAIGKYETERAKLDGRIKTLQWLVNRHAVEAGTANAQNPGAAYGFAGDLARVNALLAEAFGVLGGAGGEIGQVPA